MSLSIENLKLLEKSQESLTADFNKSSLILMKPSAGKTCLFNILIGEKRSSRGEVIFDWEGFSNSRDENIDDYDAKRGVGVIFSKHALISNLSVFENLDLVMTHKMPELSFQKRALLIQQHLQECELAKVKNKRPCELTSSQAKIVAFIRAVITNPSVLIWDEPYIPSDEVKLKYVLEEMRKLEKDGRLVIALGSEKVVGNKLGLEIRDLQGMRLVA